METVLYLFRVLKVTSPKDVRLVLKLARKLGVTYYDSSYLAASWELGTVLVTDDEKLRRRVEEGGKRAREGSRRRCENHLDERADSRASKDALSKWLAGGLLKLSRTAGRSSFRALPPCLASSRSSAVLTRNYQ